ncbi:hypothetical protein AMTR_s00020p00192750 [Amborella trichopoda]|uniref:Uncharacterized protein n=1 Tax=Amborella trichopoda TaxID=13333 RepID=W1PVZ0_AMBTC|nr:hypothetical protein AMTR_s00020p00192750 [Amborella trichopoda]
MGLRLVMKKGGHDSEGLRRAPVKGERLHGGGARRDEGVVRTAMGRWLDRKEVAAVCACSAVWRGARRWE